MKSRSLPPWPGNKQGSHSVVNVSIFAPRSNFAYIFNASRSENEKRKLKLISVFSSDTKTNNEIRSAKPFFKVRAKMKNKSKIQICFSMSCENEKWKWHLNSLFPCHRNTVGTKVHALLTFTWSCSSRKTKTTWVQNVLNLPALKFKNSMINRYFKIPQITWFGGIVHLLEDKTEKLTCVCRWNFEGRIAFQNWKLTCLRALFISLRPGQDRLN